MFTPQTKFPIGWRLDQKGDEKAIRSAGSSSNIKRSIDAVIKTGDMPDLGANLLPAPTLLTFDVEKLRVSGEKR
jgi:hypothetical protein